MVNTWQCSTKISNINSWLPSYTKILAGKTSDLVSLTLSHLYVFPAASQSAVDLSNEFHVVQERIKSIKIGETNLMGRGTSSSLT